MNNWDDQRKQRLITLLSQQKAMLNNYLAISKKQEAYINGEQLSAFLKCLNQRQRLLNTQATLIEEIRELKKQYKQDALDPAIEDMLDHLDILFQEAMAEDDRQKQKLSNLMEGLGKQIESKQKMHKTFDAYMKGSYMLGGNIFDKNR